MVKAAIESWITSTSSYADVGEVETVSSRYDWASVTSDWTLFVDHAQTIVLSSKTSLRKTFLQELHTVASLADLTLAQTMDIFELLTLTYTRYVDSGSREAVEKLLEELVQRDEEKDCRPLGPKGAKLGVAEQIVGWIYKEAHRICKGGSAASSAPAGQFVLLSWCCTIYVICLKSDLGFSKALPWPSLAETMALLLDSISDLATQARAALRNSAVIRMRRALRAVPAAVPFLASTSVSQSKAHASPTIFVPLLGVIFDVWIRLPNSKTTVIAPPSSSLIDEIIGIYSDYVLMSKVAVPSHILLAMTGFIRSYVSESHVDTTIVPTMQKSCLRSPELALPAIASFFTAYDRPVNDPAFYRILPSILNSAKSSTASARAHAVEAFRAVMKCNSEPLHVAHALDELLSLPKSGKTSGAEHRRTLYSMLTLIPPTKQTSMALIEVFPFLLKKETHDDVLPTLISAMVPYLVYRLGHGDDPPVDFMTTICKEMISSKPIQRRAMCDLAAKVLWELSGSSLEPVAVFAASVIPAFEESLKAIAANPLNSNAGPLEGCIALAIILGPIARYPQFETVIANNAVIKAFPNSSSRPYSLLLDKVYRKFLAVEEQTWLLRALQVTLLHFKSELLDKKQLRLQIGQVFLHITTHSSHADVRRFAITLLEEINFTSPRLINNMIHDTLSSYISRENGQPINDVASDSVSLKGIRQKGLVALLLASASFDAAEEASERQIFIGDLIILAHNIRICGYSTQVWIDLCQKAKLDPLELTSVNVDRLIGIILQNTLSAIPSVVDASYKAATTLTFVAPTAVLPLLSQRIMDDLSPEELRSITETDVAIWRTPEGTVYTNVLASKASSVPEKKGKNADIELWEAELRSSLGQKMASSQKLSKQDVALVNAQLKKESEIRQRVTMIVTKVLRGLALIQSITRPNVEELRPYMSIFVTILLDGILRFDYSLIGTQAYEAYLALGSCCSERLGSFRFWIGIATLRCVNADLIPEELKVEHLNSLVLRVLYRVRALAEQDTFDGATFSYVSSLIVNVIEAGGLDMHDEDDPFEQIALALEIIKFHGGEFSSTDFPRKQMIMSLLHVVKKYPPLGQDAASILLDIGEAIHVTASSEERSVLVQTTLAPEVYVRNTCLQSLQSLDLTDLDWSPELWIACHDPDEPNSRLARRLWDENGFDVPKSFVTSLSKFLGFENAYVRSSCAISFFEATDHWPSTFATVLRSLQDIYREKAETLAAEFDQYGILISQSVDRTDPWTTRLATAQALKAIAPLFPTEDIEAFFAFLVGENVLGDSHPEVRRAMLEAGSLVVDLHGSKRLQSLVSMFENYLAVPNSSTEAGDHVKEAVVILFGRVARHMDASDSRIPTVVDRLVDALKTPSEQVQLAVSDCLSPVIKFMRSSGTTVVDKLMNDLFHAQKYAERRGAAYGLAGVVRGLGIATLTDLHIVDRLQDALEDKKHYEVRQGAMFAFETLSAILGRNFEPYVIELLPSLLASFGDSVPDVREATQDAAKVIMANMSGYGVKKILPSLLAGLEEKQWRTKKGSIELLGTMAFCAPKQLSLSLPTVIPHLTGVLTDSHAQVRTSASKSLKQFGEVISNPELQSLVPILLKALVDPVRVSNALASLLKTSFTHYIDSPSLALVIPIVERGLRDRSAETKRKAAQIVGNLASLTDSHDYIPYVSKLLPLVHIVLADPVPEARATAAKSLGTLVERMGEVHFPDMVPGLLRTLKTDTSGVDRQGAAQGLSEVLAGLGMERLEALLPDIVSNAQSPRSSVREGFMSLLVFLPATFGSRFQPHLPRIVPPILAGLSDTEEYVRDAAMRAGRMIISNYAHKAIDLLLPELERGMFDISWRIRHSSITLVGELLFKVSGISGKAEIEEDEEADAVTAESSRRALVDVLGKERRDRILSALYVVRQDAVNVVRQAAIHIWKALVHNTPRTVRELLVALVDALIFLLTEPGFEPQETATRTLAELCRKFGEKMLGEIISILRNHAQSHDNRTRAGVCTALREIMENSTETQREYHTDDIVSVVRASLVDDEPNVRAAAARAFDVLQDHLGTTAIDQTIPTLLEALRQPGPSSETALQALKEVMTVRANTVFPVLIPTLISFPMTVFNTRALASLVTVAGNALNKRLPVIIGSLVKTLDTSDSEELTNAIDDATKALLGSIADSEGLNTLMMLLLEWSKSESPTQRVHACRLFKSFCEENDLDDSLYRIDWTRQLVTLLDDRVETVHMAAWEAFDSFVRAVPKDELEPLVVPLRRTIEGCGSVGHHVPGFSLPKGIAPMVPIIIAGLTTGNNEQRENAAYAIGDLVERTAEASIKPFVVPLTGPLIRVATQAMTYPPSVKSAILTALTTMLDRIPIFVKPFFPQLQRTFVKSGSDPSLTVRNKAATALGTLMRSQLRVDPVVTELIGGIRNSDEPIAASLVGALAQVVRNAGTNVGKKARESCTELILEAFKERHDDHYVQAIASLFVSLSPYPELLRSIVNSYLLPGTPASPLSSQVILAVLSSEDEQDDKNLFCQLGVVTSVAEKIQEGILSERSSIARPSREAKELIVPFLAMEN